MSAALPASERENAQGGALVSNPAGQIDGDGSVSHHRWALAVRAGTCRPRAQRCLGIYAWNMIGGFPMHAMTIIP
jgi:hypothetical protein